MSWRSLRWTWLSAGVLVAAGLRTIAVMPTPEPRAEVVAIELPPEAPPAAPQVPAGHLVISMNDRAVLQGEDLVEALPREGDATIIAVDGRTGALVRGKLSRADVTGPDAWRWRFKDLRR